MLNILFVKIKKNWQWLGYFFIFALGFIVFLYLLIPPGILCPDSFYHTKMALMIKDQGLIQDFPWTQFTTYKDLFVDHHFVYHLFLIPFLSLPTPDNLDTFSAELDPLIKAKLGTAFFAALVFLFIYWLCRRLKIKLPFVWTLSGFLVSYFILRLSLIRAPALSLILLILGFYFILKKKYLGLFFVYFFYVWTHGTWPLILIVAILYCLSQTVKNLTINWTNIFIENKKRLFQTIKYAFIYFFEKSNVKILSTCIMGLFLGLVINPYFPKTLPFYWFQTIKIGVLNYQNKIGVGAEWYSPDPQMLFFSVLPILILWLISLAWFITKQKGQNSSSWFFVFVSTFFLLYTLKARRNIEYFVPSAIFLNGLIFTQIAKKINWGALKKHLKEFFQGPDNIFYFITTIISSILVIFFIGFYLNFSIKNLFQSYTNESRSLNSLQMASHWIKTNVPSEEIIFQSNWAIFPHLFYFNTQNYYINGLDQTFMYEKDKELYQDWLDLVSYHVDPNQTAQILKEKFKASYVLVDKNDERFTRLIEKSKFLKQVYKDDQASIYQIDFNYVH